MRGQIANLQQPKDMAGKDWESFLPLASMDIHEENLQEFFDLMRERQEIWVKRTLLKLPPPWTDNPILRDYRFTNVYRELDRSSQYLIKNVYLKHNDLTYIIFCILAHRIYNKPETFEKIGYPNIHEYDETDWLDCLFSLEQQGIKTLNQEAYKINTYIWGGEPRWKAYTVHILSEYAKIINKIVRVVTNGTAEEVIKVLRSVKGCGLFLAHEYYQDFCDLNTYIAKGTTKFDKNSWTNAGPGAKSGIRLIFPSLSEQRTNEAIYWLRDLSREYLIKSVNSNEYFKYLYWLPTKKKYFTGFNGNLTCHEIEMFLCEYFKYWRMKIKMGKQRSKFTPKS